MRNNSTYNILMYSHDTYGLGHIRRTMAIAEHLRGKDVNILILTGSPIVGRFKFPQSVDFVRMPGMRKKTNDEYLPLSIRIKPQHALEIRKNIIAATAKAFKPHLFIVDKEPLGLKKEVLPTLEWFRKSLPETRTILGLRDIMDDRQTVRRDWERRDVYASLEKLYSEIWVYGNRELYDPITEYAIPDTVQEKIRFTGYIPRKRIPSRKIAQIRRENGVRGDDKLVVVTAGGGGDGYAVIDRFLSAVESGAPMMPFKCMVITGPFMPAGKRREIRKRSLPYGFQIHRFHRRMEEIIAAADLVISMGGYNTICEILTPATPSLIIPREVPRKEQLIRASVMGQQRLVDYVPWKSCSPDIIREKVHALLENGASYREAMARFRLTGLEIMRARVNAFRDRSL